jgi:hypothetical protein
VLASLKGNNSFNQFLTFTSLIQMDTSNTQAVSANLRLTYNYRPDSRSRGGKRRRGSRHIDELQLQADIGEVGHP